MIEKFEVFFERRIIISDGHLKFSLTVNSGGIPMYNNQGFITTNDMYGGRAMSSGGPQYVSGTTNDMSNGDVTLSVAAQCVLGVLHNRFRCLAQSCRIPRMAL